MRQRERETGSPAVEGSNNTYRQRQHQVGSLNRCKAVVIVARVVYETELEYWYSFGYHVCVKFERGR